MEYTFKKHPLQPHERLWLEEAAQPGFFPRRALERLRGRIPDDFRPELMDPRLYAGNRIQPIGLWHVDPQHPELRSLDNVIRAIRNRILVEDANVTMRAAEIAQAIGSEEQTVERAFHRLLDFGAGFFDSGYGPASSGEESFERIEFSNGNLFDYYRKYQGIEDLLERAYTRRGKDLYALPAHASFPLRHDGAKNEKIAEAAKTEATEAAPILYDRIIKKVKNHPVGATFLLLVSVVIGAAAVVKAVDTIRGIFTSSASSTAPSGANANIIANPTLASQHADTEDFRTVMVIPGWDAADVDWPKTPAEEEAFRALQQTVMKECGSCMAVSDHAAAGTDGVLNRPGSYVDFDARTCERGMRLAMKAFKLRRGASAPPALSPVFSSLDVVAGMRYRIDIADISTFNAAPVQCLDAR